MRHRSTMVDRDSTRRAPSRARGPLPVGPLLLCCLLALSCTPASPPRAAAGVPAPDPGAARGPEAPPSPRKLQISYATEASVSAPLWVARDHGLFEKHGLDVDLSFVRGGATNMQAMIAGSVDLAFSGASATVTSHLAGADVRFLATTAIVADQALVTRPTIVEPAQLRDKTIGLGIAGGSSLPQLLEALRRMGLGVGDVHLLDVPAGTDRLAGLVGGTFDAIVVPPTLTEQSKSLGFHVMMDLAREGVPNQGQSIVALQSYVEQNQAVVQSVLRALCEGIHLVATERPTAERAITKWARIEEPPELDAAYHAAVDNL